MASVLRCFPFACLTAWIVCGAFSPLSAAVGVGVGTKPPPGAEILFDGTRDLLDAKWTYWEGPRFGAKRGPIQWPLLPDPAGPGTVLSTDDAAVPRTGGRYGVADIVTKKTYNDFRLHVEFLVMSEGGNSGVYLQNRYEIQIQDGDATKHGMGSVINETASPYFAYKGLKQWNAYDIQFRAARFKDGKLAQRARVTVFLNGIKVHNNVEIQQVWGGVNSGLDGGNDGGRGITDVPGGLKLQAEGHDVRYRNLWIKEMTFERPNTNFNRED